MTQQNKKTRNSKAKQAIYDALNVNPELTAKELVVLCHVGESTAHAHRKKYHEENRNQLRDGLKTLLNVQDDCKRPTDEQLHENRLMFVMGTGFGVFAMFILFLLNESGAI